MIQQDIPYMQPNFTAIILRDILKGGVIYDATYCRDEDFCRFGLPSTPGRSEANIFGVALIGKSAPQAPVIILTRHASHSPQLPYIEPRHGLCHFTMPANGLNLWQR